MRKKLGIVLIAVFFFILLVPGCKTIAKYNTPGNREKIRELVEKYNTPENREKLIDAIEKLLKKKDE